jgi:hypothetical protein
VLDVGIGHRRVLAHDVHAANRARVHGVHDLDDGQPGFGSSVASPQRLELRVLDALSTRW